MSKRINHADIVVQKLRKLIVRRAIKPHARLKETELARTFGCSRVPVREAIHRLEREGLVRSKAGWGTYVPHLTHEEYMQAARVRYALEDLIETIVVESKPPRLFEKLGKIVDRMRAAAEAGNGHLVDFYDLRFHRVMAEATENPFLRASFLRVAVPMILIDDTGLRTQDDLNKTVEEHASLLKAIMDGDLERTRKIRKTEMGYFHIPPERWPQPSLPTRLGGMDTDA
jgi:DNA-binding GntR family transcriptional regulator